MNMSSVSGSGGNRGGNSGEKRGGREKRDYRKGVKLRKYTLQEKKEMVQEHVTQCVSLIVLN